MSLLLSRALITGKKDVGEVKMPKNIEEDMKEIMSVIVRGERS